MTLCSAVMQFACEVRDPYLVNHQTHLKNVQGCAVCFIAGPRGVESVTKAEKKLRLELLLGRHKTARIFYLLMKLINDDRHSSLVACFDRFPGITQDQLSTNKTFYFNNILPRTSCNIYVDKICSAHLNKFSKLGRYSNVTSAYRFTTLRTGMNNKKYFWCCWLYYYNYFIINFVVSSSINNKTTTTTHYYI